MPVGYWDSIGYNPRDLFTIRPNEYIFVNSQYGKKVEIPVATRERYQVQVIVQKVHTDDYGKIVGSPDVLYTAQASGITLAVAAENVTSAVSSFVETAEL